MVMTGLVTPTVLIALSAVVHRLTSPIMWIRSGLLDSSAWTVGRQVSGRRRDRQDVDGQPGVAVGGRADRLGRARRRRHVGHDLGRPPGPGELGNLGRPGERHHEAVGQPERPRLSQLDLVSLDA